MRILWEVIQKFSISGRKNGTIRSNKSARANKSDTLESTSNGSQETINREKMEHTEHEDWTMRSKYHYLIDAGHGGWLINDKHPEGYYPTVGKKSPKDPVTGKVVIYEGVNNRILASMLVNELKRMRISASLLVPEEDDISLGDRVRRANKENKERKCILISIHSNGAGSDGKWANAKGISLHIAPKRSKKTEQLVDIMEDEFKENFANMTKWRGVKSDNFYIISKSNCPAILCEIGFHDNLEEAKKMLTDEWRELATRSLSHSIITFEDSTP